MKLESRTLSSQAKEAILNIIDKDSDFMRKLPSEQELSSMLGVSRNTIREALKALENEGIVSRRHGVGTFVIRDSRNIKSNLAELDSFTKIITNHGYKPGTKSLNFSMKVPSKAIASKLDADYPSDLLYIDRVRTADGKSVIYVEDYINYIDGMYEHFEHNKHESLFDFLMSYDIKISFSSCDINAVISDKKLNEKLSLNKPKPLLHLQQVHYTSKGIAILYSDSYFISDKFDFNLIRKAVN